MTIEAKLFGQEIVLEPGRFWGGGPFFKELPGKSIHIRCNDDDSGGWVRVIDDDVEFRRSDPISGEEVIRNGAPKIEIKRDSSMRVLNKGDVVAEVRHISGGKV